MRAVAYRVHQGDKGDWLWDLFSEDGAVIATGRAADCVEARAAALIKALEINQKG